MNREQMLTSISLANQGLTLRQIAASIGVDPTAISHAIANDTYFEQQFSRARANGLELLADDLITLSDQEDIDRARLKSENLRWLLARRLSARYGDRVAIDVTERVDLAGAIAAARVRLLPDNDQIRRALPQAADPQGKTAKPHTDTESVTPALPDPFD